MLPSTTPRTSSEMLHALVHQLDLLSRVVNPTLRSERARIVTKDLFMVVRNCRVTANSPTTWDVAPSEDDSLWWGDVSLPLAKAASTSARAFCSVVGFFIM
jgi:hypothetical protein